MRVIVSLALGLYALTACDGAPAPDQSAAQQDNSAHSDAQVADNNAVAPAVEAMVGPYVLSSQGPRDVHTLMTIDEVRSLGHHSTITQRPFDEGATCAYGKIAGFEGLDVMLDDNRLVRFDVGDDGASLRWTTPEGARTGTSEKELRNIYGDRLTVRPHPYTGPAGHYAEVHIPGDAYGTIFETDGNKVINWRTGHWDEVGYIEGCA
ncbi:hypothetical protein FSZ31_02380 [Sphingorhabdus soli]|uniref:Lipoprotein n=1 Tax=Flavisphingopyxis soli TaxID=2601267 RepID=A0A5C6UN88_9SPHN|nr:hypothetical protein [Sphingorhabdus soli]TXC73611.1 hypothetical protein FSZ31_02380 [Sphingorhabdus soli]